MIGYIASLILIIGMLQNDIIKLRIYNILGSILFIIYAIFELEDIPIILINSILIIVNLYHILKKQK